MTAELQAGRQQLAALRAENGALKQQKTQAAQRDQKAAAESLAAAEVSKLSPSCSQILQLSDVARTLMR